MTLRRLLSLVSAVVGLVAFVDACAAAPPRGAQALRDRSGPYTLTVLVDGSPARTYEHRGETFLLGQLGARYTLRVANHSSRRVEAVVSVDGRDAIDGQPADFRSKRGYVVPPWGSVDIDGWRISHAEAAAFRFSSVRDSYAAKTGNARDVGVIGVAIFPERELPRYEGRPSIVPPAAAPASPPAKSEAPAEAESASASPTADAKSARAETSRGAPARMRRPGLGTEYGEALTSRIYESELVRARPMQPAALLGVRYDDRAGLLAMGVALDDDRTRCAYDEQDLRRTADPFPAARRFAPPPSGWRRDCAWR